MQNITYAILLVLVFPASVTGKGVYLEPEVFLSEEFDSQVPQLKKLWINAELKTAVNGILDKDLGVLRVSYWQRDNRTAWILDEIGRDHPITIGVVVNNGVIETIKVLIFRESRGWEIRYPFFTDQFLKLGLDDKKQLTGNIDGITGATLSVIAMRKVAKLALLFHQEVTGQ